MTRQRQTIAELSRLFQSGAVSSRELTEASLKRIAEHDSELNSFINVTQEEARVAADTADKLLASGKAGPLTGVPMAHKDIFCTRNITTTCGSRMLENFVSPYDATVVARLAEAGMVSVGKTNMDEFAMGSSNETSYFGAVKNPWDQERSPGGSSGGSAAAVAAGLVPMATGTDTGGSVRQPAALCGITGFKPTYGRISRFGMIAYASSLDQAGVLGLTAEDVALVMQAIAGFDARDSTCSAEPVPDYVAGLEASVSGKTIGVPKEYFEAGLDAGYAEAVHSALDVYQQMGADIREVSLPNLSLAVPAYYVVSPAEASSNLSRFDGIRFGHRAEGMTDLESLYKLTRKEGFGDEVKRRIMTGTYVLSAGYYDAYYLKAQKVRQLISNDMARCFEDVDILAGPTTPTPAFRIGEKVDDPIQMYLNDIYTVSVNLAGLPGVSIPCGLVDGLPAGLQLVGPHFAEQNVLNFAHLFQKETDWHLRVPGEGVS
ncbi:MAG: Asp-tRNA(Asn)/Glu-tRNA(Gln) amidotransferase subunit GatA [Gammaproteobacteria bacterium]|nr:Asp-tRNA(Asn)/Glu-tRNA(Gln) amidotransferase subunit GatA [Gammaproteobacteria bacterium]MCP4089557.1 Asp-tRNA(Asn)/Glu-tRNA(Gln) amidotransferase subunit GatA [Gammaproteobacteria bacterium]MCP4278108.1 Asp-tRNA(Asn)/Glu-tRNA(Gln) amidotransferase subunit GatA [Gammaproteobacteria bacterium]MCP4832448.1 Asp-tRNA(Asn)/Glu-tRNA(Gln) amidotransferase subunit GatA [Gammaproteobacteria bacterium]MCP4930085.1 Asp-tRNA(Asn)/Glu-tRNA(Gln) amidotransferase subunit GatA [Gammaproteobacteria bacterium